MIDQEKLDAILEMVYSTGAVKTTAVAQTLKITTPTARKYLDYLASHTEQIERVHGGAAIIATKQPPAESETPYQARSKIHRAEKEEIANKALALLKDRDTIVLDSSSTCFTLAKQLINSPLHLTVITNGISTAQVLARNANITVIVISGVLAKSSNTIIDEFNCDIIDRFNIDKAFFSASCVSFQDGFSEYNLRELDKKRRYIDRAALSIALIDSSKVEQRTSSSFAKLSDIDLFITDSGFDETLKRRYQTEITVK